jgi:hypothetical protein
LEDERAIRALLARYAFHADRCLDDAWVSIFAEDGVIDIDVGDVSEGTTYQHRGTAELREWISRMHQREGFRPGKMMHLPLCNLVSYIDHDTAVADTYSVVIQHEDGETALQSAGNNEWRLVKVDGRWLIRERRRRSIGSAAYLRNLEATPE